MPDLDDEQLNELAGRCRDGLDASTLRDLDFAKGIRTQFADAAWLLAVEALIAEIRRLRVVADRLSKLVVCDLDCDHYPAHKLEADGHFTDCVLHVRDAILSGR